MKKVLIILFILISNLCKAQTISIDDSSLSLEIPNIELSYDYHDVDIYVFKRISYNNHISSISGIGYNTSHYIYAKAGLENVIPIKNIEINIEPALLFIEDVDWEVVIGFTYLITYEFIITKDNINFGVSFDL